MFESEEGDAFALYAATGASANAFTSFDKTCYLFTCTDRFEENLAILLGLVSKPYFTEQTIAKEQGIIGQEIKMYEDSPEWRLVFGVYRGLYGTHPVREDIAGTVQSIARLTPRLLYSCTDAFYSPGQLVLAVAGNVTLAQVVAAAEKTPFAPKTHAVRRLMPAEPQAVAVPRASVCMDVAKPLVGVGFKAAVPDEAGRLSAEMAAEVMAERVCGSMTPLYRVLYDEHLAGPDFSGEVLSVPGAFSVLFGGETEDPARVEALVRENPDMTAVFVTNYEMTMGAVIGLNEMGVSMPDDISLVGFDNLSFARACRPALTIVSQPTEKIARETAQIMLARLEGQKELPGQIIRKLQTDIFMGKSIRRQE